MGTVAEPKTVIVTGFGPFGNHRINASWVAVQELQHLGIADDVNLITLELSVEYDVVKSVVPELWKKNEPTLVVHVGVSGVAKELTIEQQAHNDGYNKGDIRGCVPLNECCISGAPNLVKAGINMNVVCHEVNQAQCGVTAVVSTDPGRYLCDFSFYTSLNIDANRAAFIHVPPLNKPYTALELAHAIRLAIQAMLKQVS